MKKQNKPREECEMCLHPIHKGECKKIVEYTKPCKKCGVMPSTSVDGYLCGACSNDPFYMEDSIKSSLYWRLKGDDNYITIGFIISVLIGIVMVAWMVASFPK